MYACRGRKLTSCRGCRGIAHEERQGFLRITVLLHHQGITGLRMGVERWPTIRGDLHQRAEGIEIFALSSGHILFQILEIERDEGIHSLVGLHQTVFRKP